MFWMIMAIGGLLLGGGSYAMNQAMMYPPFAAGIARKTYKEHPDLIPEVAQLIAQRFKGVISVNEYQSLMMQAGYAPDIAENLYQGTQNVLSGYDYVMLWRRGFISDDVLGEKLHSAGYTADSQDDLKKATLYYPNPNDLVRMAVREVFTPEIAEQYGQFEDLPEEFLEASDKAGLSREFAKNYWASHWDLPSAMQGYEMFQRKIISKDDLTKLLKSLDYMPYWRDKLIDLQYNVVTRVDVRRLYKTGVYDKPQTITAYERMGYSPEDAKDLAEFTFKAYAPDDENAEFTEDLTRNAQGELVPSRSMIMEGYRRGIYTLADAMQGLRNLGYAEETILLLVKMEDDRLEQEIIDIKADGITDLYRSGMIDESEYRNELTALGVPSRYLEIVIKREMAQAKKRTRQPAKTDLKDWLVKGMIDPDTYILRMVDLGYSVIDANLYLQEIYIDMEAKGK